MSKSAQKQIQRKPRVQIEYEVHTGPAQTKINLPFVMGVMSDLSGNAGAEKPAVADRRFKNVDADTLDEFVKDTEPAVQMRVPNRLSDDEGEISCEVSFSSMDDFAPEAVARKIEPLADLLETRDFLRNLLSRLDGKTDAEQMLTDLLENKELLKELANSTAGKNSRPEEQTLEN